MSMPDLHDRSTGWQGFRIRMLLASTLVVAAFVGVAGYQMSRLEVVSRGAETTQAALTAPAFEVGKASAALQEIRAGLLAPAEGEAAALRRRGSVALSRARLAESRYGIDPRYEGAVDEVVRRRGGERILDARAAAREQVARALQRLDSLIGAADGTSSLDAAEVGRTVDAVAAGLDRLVELGAYQADLVRQDAAEQRTRIVASLWRLLAAAVVLVLAAAALGGRVLSRRLLHLRQGVLRIHRGELEAATFPSGSRDEIGLLSRELERLVRRLRSREEKDLIILADLQARVAEAEKASEYKTWFIGHVSHEFRTPLSSIIGFASILTAENERMSEAQRAEYLEIVLRNAKHLLHVINDILNLSKVEAGTLEVSLGAVELAEVVETATAALAPMAEDRELAVTREVAPGLRVQADAGRLRQVLLNLVENAIKYSPVGSRITVGAVREGDEIVVSIRDLGPGIAEEDQQKLFKEFSRIHVDGKKVAGAGLGLALSKRLVDLMHGEIGVDSARGRGSTFWIRLPVAAATSAPPSPSEVRIPTRAPTGHGERIAVVDDEPDILTLVSALLTREGYRAVTDNGRDGLSERMAVVGPAAILLDLDLGCKSGVDALRELRATPELAETPIIAFTASSTSADRKRASAAGFTGFLPKPVAPGALYRTLERVLPSSAGDGEDFLGPLRERFRDGIPGRLASIGEFRGAGDRSAMIREVHKLRGAAGGYGYQMLSHAAGELEEALRNPDTGLDDPRVAFLMEMLRRGTGEALPVGTGDLTRVPGAERRFP
jgi:signal transduction histidine kinase/HPt (histidine-containing phosphotransfer) domain-containing protein